jgi:hypothetical protein
MLRLLDRVFRRTARKTETTDPRKDVWARIGLLLALLQQTELAIKASLKWVFTTDPFGEEHMDNLLDQLANLKEFERKRTLGQLQSALRGRVDTGPDFDAFFTQFVEDRNRFIHRLFTEPGFNVNDPEDVGRIREFVDSLTERAIRMLVMFHGFLDMWAEEHKLGSDDDATRPEPFQTAVQQFKDKYRRRTSEGDEKGG